MKSPRHRLLRIVSFIGLSLMMLIIPHFEYVLHASPLLSAQDIINHAVNLQNHPEAANATTDNGTLILNSSGHARKYEKTKLAPPSRDDPEKNAPEGTAKKAQ